jgi:tetratricopeptide (TPR) repeat protein
MGNKQIIKGRCYMKKIILVLQFLFIFGNFLYSQEYSPADPIKGYYGIPILTYTGDNLFWNSADSLYKQMDSAGIFGTEVANMIEDYYTNSLHGTNIMVIPNNVDGAEYNYINKYTDAYYSVWEAEGTHPENGDATLYYNNSIGEIYNGIVRTKVGIANDTLIYGPYYLQEIKYPMVQNETRIEYRADFIIKKEDIDPQMFPGANDTICILQVTTSHASGTLPLYLDSTFVIKDTVLTYSDLADTFKTFSLNYDYFDVPNLFTSDTSLFRAFSDYIQYKVLWKGNSNILRLYVDKIILTDDRGRRIRDLYSDVENEIRSQIQNDFSSNYSSRVAGWMGLDEPASIDQFEPIRVVQNIVDTYGQGKGLWLATGTGYNGRWGVNVPVGEINPFGTYSLKTFEEFYKRVGKANLWSDYYLYIFPNQTYGSDYRDAKIKYMVDTVWGQYQNKENVFWGASVQTGGFDDTSYSWLQLREIDSKDLLYNVNIALLAGAKLVSLWTYFANPYECDTTYRSALINIVWPCPRPRSPQTSPLYIEYTDKWYTLKDTIAPRLKGLMGKTLKKLNHYKHYLGIDAVVDPEYLLSYEYIDFIKATGSPNDTCLVELGFFEDPFDLSNRFFMLVNRYYSTLQNMRIGLRYLTGFNNWKVTDYVDTTSLTLIQDNGTAEFTVDIYPGDAKLYSVGPVVKYGGTLIANETITSGSTFQLEEDLVVSTGVTLTIQPNVTLQFKNNSKLIVEGTLNANGTSANKITFNFVTPNDNGILVKEGGSLYLNHANIYNASTGIETEPKIENLKVYLTTFTNCTEYGVNILGESSLVPHIMYSQFNGSNYGIYAAGVVSIIIKQNTITNTKIGISLVQVPESQVIGNNITSTNNVQRGIFMNSSSGYVRQNTITGHSIGIELLNSSPYIGGNTINDNYVNGIHVTSGSVPDLRGSFVISPCGPPLYYALSGFNYIYENGGWYNIALASNDDGSEIFINNSYILLDVGCNTISDDREPSGQLQNIINLMNGSVGGEFERSILAKLNDWGDNPLYDLEDRFGDLLVEFDPPGGCEIHEAEEPCPLIIYDLDNGVIDTLYAIGGVSEEEEEIEMMYAEAEGFYNAGEHQQSYNIYNQIITQYPDSIETADAYIRLFRIERIRNSSTEVFAQLKSYYDTQLISVEDETLIKVLTQLSTLCLIGEELYVPAIDAFEEVIQNNPETDEALSAEIDALTISLLASYNGTPLGKHTAGSLAVRDSKEYGGKIKNLLLGKYGTKNKKSEEAILPTEYNLYQNYPNPFNPTTVIRYDIPKQSTVEVIIFDILGRKVKTLVNNEQKQPGRYEASFNAGNLPSGVYFYRITATPIGGQAGDYVSTKKMMLVK